MQRWQRRTHLWLWLIVAIVVTTVLAKLVEDQPYLAALTEAPGQQ
jgi:hypothetical protein